MRIDGKRQRAGGYCVPSACTRLTSVICHNAFRRVIPARGSGPSVTVERDMGANGG